MLSAAALSLTRTDPLEPRAYGTQEPLAFGAAPLRVVHRRLLEYHATVCCLLRGLVVLLQGDFTFALSAGLLSTCCCRCCSRYGVDVFAHSARARRDGYSRCHGPYARSRQKLLQGQTGLRTIGESRRAARAALRQLLLVTLLSSSVVVGGGGDPFTAVLVWRCKLLL